MFPSKQRFTTSGHRVSIVDDSGFSPYFIKRRESMKMDANLFAQVDEKPTKKGPATVMRKSKRVSGDMRKSEHERLLIKSGLLPDRNEVDNRKSKRISFGPSVRGPEKQEIAEGEKSDTSPGLPPQDNKQSVVLSKLLQLENLSEKKTWRDKLSSLWKREPELKRAAQRPSSVYYRRPSAWANSFFRDSMYQGEEGTPKNADERK